MRYARFGNTGLNVSRLCIGCMDFPTRISEEEAARLVDGAIDSGINLFDTAESYKGSEELLGKLLEGKREKVIVASKAFERRKIAGYGSRLHLTQAVERSLTRLRTDYIDLYQLHHPDQNTPVEETLSTLDAMVKQGKIRYIGVSNHYAWQIAHALGVAALHNWEPVVSAQSRYNALDRVAENELLPCCKRFNLATMTYGPLNWGVMSGSYKRGMAPQTGSRLEVLNRAGLLTDAAFDAIEPMEEIASRLDTTLPRLAVAWLLAKPAVTSVVLGGSKREHFEDLYPVTEMELGADDVAAIDRVSEPFRFGRYDNQPYSSGAPPALDRW